MPAQARNVLELVHKCEAELTSMGGLHHPDLTRDRECPCEQAPSALGRAARGGDQPERLLRMCGVPLLQRRSLEESAREVLRARPFAGVSEHNGQAADAQLLVVA